MPDARAVCCDSKHDHLANEIAQGLLEIGAFSFSPSQPYTWASGMISPVYCDNRLVMASPSLRRRIRDGLCGLIESHQFRPDVIVGTATAGIPHAAWVSEALTLPMAYVRSTPKGHGRKNQIEGRVESGQQVVVIEDLVSTGGSVLRVVEVLKERGAAVAGVTAVFTYNFEFMRQSFVEQGINLVSLVTFEALLQKAVEAGALLPDDRPAVESWHSDPMNWTHGLRSQS